ncbi:MAG: restriction endonuclease subunit S [Anaerolineaceae bacterium]|nr:restriction endonuclease subunit S [Anaerolineaceae bacterium]
MPQNNAQRPVNLKTGNRSLDSWRFLRFKEIADLGKERISPQNIATGLACIELENISKETGQMIGVTDPSKQSSQKNVFYKGNVLFGKLRPYLKKFLYCDFDGVCSSEIWVLSSKNGCQSKYLFYLIQTSQFIRIADQSSGTKMPRADWTNVSKLVVPIPSVQEQEKIIQILSTWDRGIERVQRLIEAKQQRKKGLMQGLLTGRLRFPEFGESINTSEAFPTDWEVKKLKQVFSQIDRPLGSHIPESVLSISAKIGFVDQKTKFGKVVAGKSLEIYILLQRGEFAYNRGNSNAYPQGCIYMLTEYDEGAIPNVYYAFRVKSGDIFPQFYQYYFESGLLNPQLKMFISSSARGDGLFNISSKDFFGIKIVVPPFEEQKMIASVLCGIDEQIALLKKYLEKLKEQKKGLMQKLLTGEIRVKVN